MAHLGDKLKAFRRGKNWKQPQMADYLDIGHRAYQDIEKSGIVKKSDVLARIKNKTAIDTQIFSPDISGQSELMPILVELMKKQNTILENQNSIITDKFSTVESNLNAVLENQQVGDARQRRSLEVLFGLHLGVQPEKTVQELINVVDTGAVDSFVPKKKKGIHSDAGK